MWYTNSVKVQTRTDCHLHLQQGMGWLKSFMVIVCCLKHNEISVWSHNEWVTRMKRFEIDSKQKVKWLYIIQQCWHKEFMRNHLSIELSDFYMHK